MKDRVPASGKGGRVSLAVEGFSVSNNTLNLTATDGAVYGILGHADDAVQVGSMYNKSNVLPASVTSALGLTDESAEPKDAFMALSNKIVTANNNIATVTNLVNGNYADIAASDVGTHSTGQNDGHSDWRTGSTNATDFLLSLSYRNGHTSGNTISANLGSVRFDRTVEGNIIGSLKGRFWRSGGIWFVMWADGILDWVADNNPNGGIVVSASIKFASDYNDINVTNLTVKGR